LACATEETLNVKKCNDSQEVLDCVVCLFEIVQQAFGIQINFVGFSYGILNN